MSFDILSKSPAYKKEFILVFLIEDYFRAADLELSRMEREPARDERLALHADLRFFLMTATWIANTIKQLRTLRNKDGGLIKFHRKYIPVLETWDRLRDHLVHIEERLEEKDKKGKFLAEPDILGHFEDGVFHFGPETFDMRQARTVLDGLRSDFKAWSGAQYPTPET